MSRVDKILYELTDMTWTTGIVIGGCGCCGSPYITLSKKPPEGWYVATEDTDRNGNLMLTGLRWVEKEST